MPVYICFLSFLRFSGLYVFFSDEKTLTTHSVCLCMFLLLSFFTVLWLFLFLRCFLQFIMLRKYYGMKRCSIVPIGGHLKLWENTPTRRQILKACFGAFDPPLKYYLIQNHIYTLFLFLHELEMTWIKVLTLYSQSTPWKEKTLKCFDAC